MSKRDKAPAPIVMKTPRGLSPVAAYDQEVLIGDPMGTQYDLVKRQRRSLPQHRLYWLTLSRIVKATGRWPSAEHLNDELKLVTGFYRMVADWETGEVSKVVDSIAFDAMDQDQFKRFFDLAMLKLTEHLGFDPLAYQIAEAA